MAKRSSQKKKEFAFRLMKWYNHNKRDFPWRFTTNPYHILISEIMLQRTRANNVVPIYNEFIKRYPTISELQKANHEEVESLICPLGLFKPRTEVLLNIAKAINRDFEGEIPLSQEELLSFKGIGYYIANAILCVSGTEKKSVVDWNVVRVIKRVWKYKMKSSPHTDRELMEFVDSILHNYECKNFNWSLLDFAAIVCKPSNPDCINCPMNDICLYAKRLKI